MKLYSGQQNEDLQSYGEISEKSISANINTNIDLLQSSQTLLAYRFGVE